MPYTIYKSDGSFFVTIEDGQINTANSSLTLLGKNVVNYGQYENTNLVKLLENFSNNSSPANPLAGQLWFDKTSNVLRLKVFNGTSWNNIPNFIFSNSTPALNPGDFWWKEDSQELYIRSTSSNVLIGGSSFSSPSANRLTTPRTINGVSFDGTSNITVSSTITNKLIIGDFLTGDEFNGSVTTTVSVDVGSINSPDPLKVVARDSGGDIWFTVGHGLATSSRYADLAEKYLADQEYEIGTVVTIGGINEITACQPQNKAIGVISKNPAVMMNSDLEGGVYVALKGRVPVNVSSKVLKKQYLIPGLNGKADVSPEYNSFVFAIALSDSNEQGQVEAIIL